MTWSKVLQSLIHCDNVPWSILKEHQHSQLEGQEQDYFNACKLILMRLDNSFIIDEHEDILDNIILKHQPSILITLVTSLSTNTVESYRRDKLADLITKFIYKPGHLEHMLIITKQDDLESTRLINIIISTPSFVSNALKLKASPLLAPANYFHHVCQSIHHCFLKVHQKFKDKQDFEIKFLAQLCGRICFNGHSDVFYDQVLKPILNFSEQNSIWQKLGHSLISIQNDAHLENVIKPIFRYCQNPAKINLIFKDLILRNKKLEYLLTIKFTTISYFMDTNVITNIVYYVFNQSSNLLINIFSNLLDVWGDGRSLKYRMINQQLYICSYLIVCSNYLNLIDLEQVKSKLIRSIIYGIEVYLKSVQDDVRTTGLYVGQVLISKLQIDGSKLDFEIEKNEYVQKLMELLSSHPMTSDKLQLNSKTLEKSEDDDTDDNNNVDNCELIEKPDAIKVSELDSDDDDDLVPFNLSNDTRIEDTKKPVYLRDCIAGLQDTNNPDWFKICLENASTIIENSHSMIEEVAIDFARTLLCLNNDYEFENFENLRQDALVKLCYYSPISVSKFLTSQFYDRNYVIRQRLDILEVLAIASQKLSSHSDFNQIKTNEELMVENIISKDIVMVEKQWKSMLTKKSSKHRIISTPKEIKTYINRFAPVAGYFFFPLMKSFDKPDITFDLIEEDYFLLGRLLYTLGIILNSAAFSPISRQMGEALMQFLWVFRYHTESFVRQALLFCFCTILTSVPPIHIFEHLQIELLEFKQWLIDITEKDTNETCVKRSFQALYLLKETIDHKIK